MLRKLNVNNYKEIINIKITNDFTLFVKKLIKSKYNFLEKKKIFYLNVERYKLNSKFKPRTLFEKIIFLVMKCKILFFLTYIYVLRDGGV